MTRFEPHELERTTARQRMTLDAVQVIRQAGDGTLPEPADAHEEQLDES